MKSNIGLFVFLSFMGLLIHISCKKELTCGNCFPSGNVPNQPPVANAGADQQISLPTDSIMLNGTASSDVDGIITSYKWTKISGPPSSNIIKTDSSITMVKTLVMGVYQIELTVKDNGGLTAKDTVQIIVSNPAQPNRPPVACAGPDQTINLPNNAVTLSGSCSADPDNNITAFTWTKIFGPPTFNIANANYVQTQVTNLVQGNYQFELKVTDAGGLFAKDTIQVTVAPDPSQLPCDNLNRPEITVRLTPIGALSKPRVGMAVAAAGNKIVFAGGLWTANCPECWGSSRVDIYDVTTNTWSTAELSTGRWSIGATAAGNKIFFAGGQSGDGAFDTYYTSVDIYDASANLWTLAYLSEQRGYVSAGTVGNKVLFAGGEFNMNYETTATVDIYDMSTGAWTSSRLSGPRSGISAVTVNDKLYFAGGDVDDRWYNNPSGKIDIYNNTTNSWSTSNLSEPMHFLTGITMTNQIYWAAGCTVEIKDVNTWNSVIAHPYKTMSWGVQSVVKNNFILFLGGLRGSLEKKLDIYNTTTNTWSVGVVPVEIEAAISYNNVVYVTDGVKVYTLDF